MNAPRREEELPRDARETGARGTLVSLLSRYFDRVPIPGDFEPVAANAPRCVVVAQGRSLVIEALLSSFARRAGLGGARYAGSVPGPDGRVIPWVSLHDGAALARLRGSQHQFSTLNIFERRGPIRTNPHHRLIVPKLVALLVAGRTLVIRFGVPFAPDTSGRSGSTLTRQLKIDFYRTLRLVRGTPLQSPAAQQHAVLGGAEFDREVGLLAQKLRCSRETVLRKLRREFRALAANPVRLLHSAAARVCRLIAHRLFSEVHVLGLERFVEVARKDAVVLVPIHRSHLDYILISWKLYQSNLNPPLIAAGVNLSFWPIGSIVRSLGGYFVRRNARHNRVHALVLRRYVAYLVRRGHLQEFFIEGGRSRSGKMRAPRLGLLSVMVDVFLRGHRRDIQFVPVSITYDQVVEDRSFAEENTGKEKERESLISLASIPSVFRNRYGEVAIAFGEPISLRAFAAGRGAGNGREQRELVRDLADTLTRSIRDGGSIGFTPLAYAALLSAPHYGMRKPELALAVSELARYARVARSVMPFTGEFTSSLERFLAGHRELIDDLVRRGVVQRSQCLDGEFLFIPGKRRYTADFYRNSVLHLFAPLGLFATAAAMRAERTIDEALELHSAFESDLFLAPREEFRRSMEGMARALLESGDIAELEPGRFVFTNEREGAFLPGLLHAHVQGVVWVYDNLRTASFRERLEAAVQNGAAGVPYKEFLPGVQREVQHAKYLGSVTRTEATSQSALLAALETVARLGFVTLDDAGQRIRALALPEGEPDVIARLRRADRAVRTRAVELGG